MAAAKFATNAAERNQDVLLLSSAVHPTVAPYSPLTSYDLQAVTSFGAMLCWLQQRDDDSWDGDDAAAAAAEAVAAMDDERLRPEENSAVTAAKGSNADCDVLQVTILRVGPLSKRGSYR